MVHIISYFLPYLSTALNPLILFTFTTRYRQGLKDCLRLEVVKCRVENVELPERFMIHGDGHSNRRRRQQNQRIIKRYFQS